MGRHSLPYYLSPWKWPRRVALLVAVMLVGMLGLVGAIQPGTYGWVIAQVERVLPTPSTDVISLPNGWEEVSADNPGNKSDKPDNPGTDLRRPLLFGFGVG